MPRIQEAAELPPLKLVSSKPVIIAEPESTYDELCSTTVPVEAEQIPRNSLPPKQYHTNASRRLSGRMPPEKSPSLHSISSISSLGSSSILDPPEIEAKHANYGPSHHVRHHDRASHIISQVAEWLHNEKAKKAVHKHKPHGGHAKLAHAAEATRNLVGQVRSDESKHHKERHGRTSSDLSDGGLALEKLEKILSESMDLDGDGLCTPTEDKTASYFPRRRSKRQISRRLLRRNSTIASSDTDSKEPDVQVPSAEVILDNSKTLGYSGGVASSEADHLNQKKRAAKEKEAWLQFKHEIIRLAHTLRLKGWRRVPLERGGDMDVERLSGALTNAVYVVSPPANLPQTPSVAQDRTTSLVPKKPPPKLLLRIYGPQVEHLINRESELQILCRLARKKIGPRLLGTFTNGRFEEFFHARTLTAKDLRIPETSKQIAKRMRELHDGIELLDKEREDGAFIWSNWDKWVDRCEEVISWLDHEIIVSRQKSDKSRIEGWKKRGLVCGVEWCTFRRTVEQYRQWLYEQYGGEPGIRQELVFAHNDTQYGNLLRIEPSGESPLLLPANEHKQLIVIDFEYASANVPGLEFANHFTEWCYNYHDRSRPYALNANRYPTPEEQKRFLKAYVQHRPPIQSCSSFSPATAPTPCLTSSISSFMLDSRAPPAQIDDEEKQREQAVGEEIKRLMHQTRIWRVANSAQWVAWGIVQAKVPGMNEALEVKRNATPESSDAISQSLRADIGSDPLDPEMAALARDAHNKRPESREGEIGDAHEEEEEEFDYLGYAQERAMFFWGDVLQLGIKKRKDLPLELLEKVKIVEY